MVDKLCLHVYLMHDWQIGGAAGWWAGQGRLEQVTQQERVDIMQQLRPGTWR